MKTKFFLTVFFVLILLATLGWRAGSVMADSTCDSEFVAKSGNVLTVMPTGMDDTANIQCAFDAAVAAGSESEVRLGAGTFHTAQIVVNDFHGKFTGAGMTKTTVYNLPNLYVTPVDVNLNPPSAVNPWPNLFSFTDGDFVIADLAIHIVGDDLTTGWTIFGIDPPFEEFSNIIMIAGTRANAQVDRVLLEGEKIENSAFGYNVINGIFYENFIGEVPPPMSGSYSLTNSTIRTIPFGSPVYNLSNASVLISGNSYDDTIIAADVSGGLQYSSYEFSHNKIDNSVFGLDVWGDFGPYDGSSFLVKNNVFRVAIGIAFEQTSGSINQCLITGNNVSNAVDLGIYLGPDTTGCTVIGGNNKTTVFDEGIGNTLVGVNNMGAGVGPNIQSIRKLFK